MLKPPLPPKPLSESIIQSKVIKAFEKEGWFVVKIIQTTKNGWPDLQCHRNKITVFIECKEENKLCKDQLQLYRHKQLREQGFTVFVINHLNRIENALKESNLL